MPIGAPENNNSEQNPPHSNQASNISPITQQKSLPNNSAHDVVSQGHGQKGSEKDQRSPAVQSKEQQSSEGQILQVKSQAGVDSNLVQSLPVLQRQDVVESNIGQRSSTHPDHPDNLRELNLVPAGQGPNIVNQPQDLGRGENVLPQVQIQQGLNVRDPSPQREGEHVPTNVTAAPRFSIQGSDDDEESPPTPKGKFFV